MTSREVGPERGHFGGLNGLVKVQRGGKVTWYWECIHCNWRMGGKSFHNEKARVHLSGDQTLRCGLITQVCTKAPEHIKKLFQKLEREKRQMKQETAIKRKRAAELLASSPKPAASTSSKKVQAKAKQCRLPFAPHRLPNSEVDDAWAKAFFGLDLTPNKIDHELFREAITATSRSKGT